MKYEAILFDLDGTLLDTALDLADATNYVLKKHNVAPISDAQAKKYASDGMRALLKSGIDEEKWDQYDFEEMRLEFLEYYNTHINVRTVFFKDMDKLLNALNQNNIKVGIVTSKPDHLANLLLRKFKEFNFISEIVGCDLLTKSKPDPEPLLYTCNKLNVDPKKCVYIGDHIRDIEAGKNANMDTILAKWGYIKEEDLHSFKATYIAEDVAHLAKIIGVEL
jgi:phosphoglycolate phosphatase